MSKAGSKVGIYTTENRWGGPQFQRTGSVACKGGREHSWYRWQPTNRSEVDGDDPWLYWHECSVMGCDAKEYAADLPDLHDVLALVKFMDQRGAPPNTESLHVRLRDLYPSVVKIGRGYQGDPNQWCFWEAENPDETYGPYDSKEEALSDARKWSSWEDWVAFEVVDET